MSDWDQMPSQAKYTIRPTDLAEDFRWSEGARWLTCKSVPEYLKRCANVVHVYMKRLRDRQDRQEARRLAKKAEEAKP